jgi:hypothetical protein
VTLSVLSYILTVSKTKKKKEKRKKERELRTASFIPR